VSAMPWYWRISMRSPPVPSVNPTSEWCSMYLYYSSKHRNSWAAPSFKENEHH
jgi:hypothetical protein